MLTTSESQIHIRQVCALFIKCHAMLAKCHLPKKAKLFLMQKKLKERVGQKF
jgi:hypothetical protein